MSETEVAAFRAVRRRLLDDVAEACARAGRDPAEVAIVAVSKTVSVPRIRAAVEAGLTVLGENRVQEAAEKIPLVAGARWHLIGPLQTNKARRAVELFEAVESVHSLELARRLDRLAGEAGRARMPVYLQVNVDRDPGKSGFEPAEIEAALPDLAALERLELAGLMTVGRLVVRAEEARPTFAALRELSKRLRSSVPALGGGLSMGMSDDFVVAVEEGATVLRLGRLIFGDRPARGLG